MTHQPSVVVFNDLGIDRDLEDREFRNQFFRTEREIDIPVQLKELRKLRGLNQTELAELAGTKQSAISRLERSQEAKWELETLVKLAEALDARLSVVIEPYENVIARYKEERRIQVSSAATALTETRQSINLSSALNGVKIDQTRARTSVIYETFNDRKQQDSLSYAGSSPKRSSVLAGGDI